MRAMSKESAEHVAKELTALFPKTNKKPKYSKGFQRWLKLSRKKQQELVVRHNFNQQSAIAELEEQS